MAGAVSFWRGGADLGLRLGNRRENRIVGTKARSQVEILL